MDVRLGCVRRQGEGREGTGEGVHAGDVLTVFLPLFIPITGGCQEGWLVL